MIEKLKKKDIVKAAKVCTECMLMQNPPNKSRVEENIQKLTEDSCFVYKAYGKIIGLLRFKDKKPNIELKFVCTLRKRRGIGKRLMKHLAKHAKENKIKTVITTVSSVDQRAMDFYDSLGFKKYGQYKSKRWKNFVLCRTKAKTRDILK